jgi:hypothetical protein
MEIVPPKAEIRQRTLWVNSGRRFPIITGRHKKGTAEHERHSDPFCDPPNLGTPGLGNSAFLTDSIGAQDQSGCAINHTVRSNATFCDAQHIALNGVSVFS